MLLGKMLRTVTLGIILGILALGLLPFLIIFNWAEMLNVVQLETSPFFLLLGRFMGNTAPNSEAASPPEQNDLD